MFPGWKLKGRCTELTPSEADQLFFPSKSGRKQSHPPGKLYCQQCPVREACFEYGFLYHEAGWWGGYSEQELQAMRDLTPDLEQVLKLEASEAGLLEVRSYSLLGISLRRVRISSR